MTSIHDAFVKSLVDGFRVRFFMVYHDIFSGVNAVNSASMLNKYFF